MAVAASDVSAKSKGRRSRPKRPGGRRPLVALAFLLPALILLGALVVYPVVDTVAQSFQDQDTRQFIGLENYRRALDRDTTITALKNTLIWVILVPGLITGGGLIFAVLSERVRYGTAIKVILFMPMAISALSVGVIWRIMYEQDPSRGFVNAVIGAGVDTVKGEGAYPNATVSAEQDLVQNDQGVISEQELNPGDTVTFGLVSITDEEVPGEAEQAAAPEGNEGAITAVAWRDFKPGGGTAGEIEDEELGLPNVAIELLDSEGEVVATETTGSDGSVAIEDPGGGPFTARVAASNFDEGFQGFAWLAPALVTPSIIAAFIWGGIGFAVIVIGAGLAALPPRSSRGRPHRRGDRVAGVPHDHRAADGADSRGRLHHHDHQRSENLRHRVRDRARRQHQRRQRGRVGHVAHFVPRASVRNRSGHRRLSVLDGHPDHGLEPATLQEGRSMSSTAEGIAGPRIAAKSEPISRRLARTFSRGPLNAFLIMIGLFWLIPSFGPLDQQLQGTGRLRGVRLVDGVERTGSSDSGRIQEPDR